MHKAVITLAFVILNLIQLSAFYLFPQNLDNQYPLDSYALVQPQRESYQQLFSLDAPDHRAPIALLVELNTGTILYRHNADMSFPPASLTKIMTVYTALEIYEASSISMEDTAHFSEAAWAVNAPPGSSLMFLDRDQTVTIGEILLGLLVSSGNDAAMAIAETSTGSMPGFILRMNNNAIQLGLDETSFVEPSGYDARNQSSAMDLARLSQHYIGRWPWVINRFHRVRELSYPREEHMGAGSNRNFLNITQYNRNGLLDSYPGSTGLKTGYIDESGYNIMATAKRDGMHLLAVVMGIQADSSNEGSRLREEDATKLLDFGYDNFSMAEVQVGELTVDLRRSEEKQLFFPGQTLSLVVKTAASQPRFESRIAGEILGPVDPGQRIASYRWTQDNHVLAVKDLRADYETKSSKGLRWLLESIALFFERLFGNKVPVQGSIDGFSLQ